MLRHAVRNFGSATSLFTVHRSSKARRIVSLAGPSHHRDLEFFTDSASVKQLAGYGTLHSVFTGKYLHVGYLIDLPRHLTSVLPYMLQVGYGTTKLVVDPSTYVLFKDDLLSIVLSPANKTMTVLPNLPISIKSVAEKLGKPCEAS